MEVLKFEDRKVTNERTHTVTGKVLFAKDYITDKKNLKGVELQLEGVPYKLRVLSNMITGGADAKSLLNCTVKVDGDMRKYQDKDYFNPRDLNVVKQSVLAQIATAGVAYSGSLD